MMQPRGRSQNGQRVALGKAIDTNIRGVIPSSRSSTQVALLTCGACGENHAQHSYTSPTNDCNLHIHILILPGTEIRITQKNPVKI